MDISWSGTASAIAAVVAAGLLTWVALAVGGRLPGRPGRYVARFRRTAGTASIATVSVVTALTALPWAAVAPQVVEPAVRRLLILLLVGCAAWLVVQATSSPGCSWPSVTRCASTTWWSSRASGARSRRSR